MAEVSTEDKTISEKSILRLMNHCKAEIKKNNDEKVDKVSGKGLSTNDYTNAEKTKLAGLSNYDDTTISGRVSDIEKVIPSTASEDNKLATMADISSGSGDTVDYNSLLTLITEDSGQASENIVQVGETYTLGSGAKTNRNNSIQVKCLSIDNKTAIMQTYGVTAGSWPGSGDLTESYSSYWGELSSAISEVKLPTGNSKDNIEPSGAYEILKTAATNYGSFGAVGNYAWLDTPYGSDIVYSVSSNGKVYDSNNFTGNSYVCAPLFTLDLSKISINNGVIEFSEIELKDAEFSDLVTKIETKLNNRYTKSEVDTALNNKVDKVNGKGLSTNDFTDTEKTKLAGLSNYDDTGISSRVSDIEEAIPSTASSSNKLATAADISTLTARLDELIDGSEEEF